jgi:hypothetical protein
MGGEAASSGVARRCIAAPATEPFWADHDA